MAACELRLQVAVAGATDERLRALVRTTVGAGGKRLRPMLVAASAPAQNRGSERQRLVFAAAAVELLHTATLVHDDLIDGAPLRRGTPTVAASAGAAAAVQVGDYLMARAMAELTLTGEPRAVAALAEATRALTQGELAQQASARDLGLGEADYLGRCRGKTGALFAASCRLGALLGGAGPEVQARLARFGELLGVAFQILDDVLDLIDDGGAGGKRRGADLRDGTVTLPVILALQEEPALATRVRRAMEEGVGIEPLCDRLAAHAGVARARERARDLIDRAHQALDAPLDGVEAAALAELAARAVGSGRLAEAVAE